MRVWLAASVGLAVCLACSGLAPLGAPRVSADEPLTTPDNIVCALLINGDDHDHHTQNIHSAAAGLIQAGVQAQNIFVVSQQPLPTDLIPHHQASISDLQGFLYEFELLKGCLTPGGTLVVYLTGHGNQGQDGSGINT